MIKLKVVALLGLGLLSGNALAQSSGTFVATGSMATSRAWGFTATLLRDGRVLITGGHDGQAVQASAELYDPTTGTFRSTGPMATPRSGHTATLLNDGRVLIAGGSAGRNPSAEVYDPFTGTFMPTGDMVTPTRGAHAATLLRNGKVLISGGVTYPMGIAPAPPELYDSVSGTFAPAGEVTAGGASSSTLLYDGEVLIAGGWRTDSAALYDSTSERFTSLGHLLSPGLWDHSATLLPNGKVLLSGGRFFDGSDAYNAYGEESLATAQLYDPSLRRFKATGSMLEARDDHTATLLPGGLVLVAGGDWNLTRVLSSAELYDPATGAFTHTGAMTESRVYHTATLLQDGTVLIAGGESYWPYAALASAEIYLPPITAVSSASKMAPLAPESLGSIFGSGLANRTESADSLSPPTTLGDISLRLVDSSGAARLVPLFYVSPSQITFEVPAGTATGNATVEVVNAPAQPAQSMAEIDKVAPALFAYNDNSPIAYALRIEPDGQQTVLYIQNTIGLDDRPVYLVLYATGIRNRSALASVQCTIGGVGVPVEYAGPEGSGIPGLDQVNVRLTAALKGKGVDNLTLTVDGVRTNSVVVNIK